ncbi:hypothetical protein SAMN06298226_2131 [Nitrosovibrio sp. Nv4]|nr:hypothetical protein SAMN06298226_2131 [Nitrosovibrio sp. Nv4]
MPEILLLNGTVYWGRVTIISSQTQDNFSLLLELQALL